MTDERLSRMENKIDQLVNAMTTLVRVEEKQQAMLERLNHHASRINTLDERTDTIEKEMPLIRRFMNRADKISLTLVTTLVVGGALTILGLTYG